MSPGHGRSRPGKDGSRDNGHVVPLRLAPAPDTPGRRRDRTGEPLDELPDELAAPHRCRRGWVGEDDQGRPIPCITCRPHLPGMLARQRAWDGRP